MIPLIFILILTIHWSQGIIFNLNKSQHALMPPVYRVDSYQSCVERRQIYCNVEMNLVAEEPSDLMDMIQEYSAYSTAHLNHSHLQYYVCVNETCGHILRKNKSRGLRSNLEACLNESLWKSHKLRVRLDSASCWNAGEWGAEIEALDLVVAGAVVALIVTVLIASFREIYKGERNTYLKCFSIPNNWRKLTAAPKVHDRRLEVFLQFYGVRALAGIPMVLTHAFYSATRINADTHYFEELCANVLIYFMAIPIGLQLFFGLSGLLLSMNMEIYMEKHRVNWRLMPIGIINRLFRIMPAVLFALALTSTWARFIWTGPFWQDAMATQAQECRREWWLVVLNLINYVGELKCLAELWYICADLHLTILGLGLFVLVPKKTRDRLLWALLAFAVFWPALVTYYYDLEAVPVVLPKFGQYKSILQDPNIAHAYIKTDTNLAVYVMGLMLGSRVYRMMNSGFDVNKYMTPLTHFLYFVCCLSLYTLPSLAGVYFPHVPRPSLAVRVLLCAIYQPLYGFLLAIAFIGGIYKVSSK